MFVQVNSTLIQTDTTSFGISVAVVFWTIWGILHSPVVFPLTIVMWKLQLWLLLKDVPSTLSVIPQHKRYISPVWRRSFFGEIFITLLNISDLHKWSSWIYLAVTLTALQPPRFINSRGVAPPWAQAVALDRRKVCVVYVSGFGFPSFMAIRVHIVENWFLPITMLSYPYLIVLGRMNRALSFTLVTWFRRLMYSFITALRLISSICSGTWYTV